MSSINNDQLKTKIQEHYEKHNVQEFFKYR